MNESKVKFVATGKGRIEPDGSNTLIVTVEGFLTKGEVHEFGMGLVDFINKQLVEKYGEMKNVRQVFPIPSKETVN